MLQRIQDFFSASNRRLHISIISLVFLVSFLLCGIVNLVMERTLSWSLIVLGVLLFCWFVIFMLLYMKKRAWLWALGSMCVLAVPLMLWIELTGPNKGWAIPLGAPVAALLILYIALVLALFAFVKWFEVWYKLSISTALLIPLSIAINGIIARYTARPVPLAQTLTTGLLLLCLALVFFLLGFMRKSRRGKKVHPVERVDK